MAYSLYDNVDRHRALESYSPRSGVGCPECFFPSDRKPEQKQYSSIKIRLADSDNQRSKARLLINRMYGWRGYGSDHVVPISPNHVTFTAADCCRTTGTITLAIDSAAGIAADTLFRTEIDEVRARPGAKVCELTKLAFNAETPSKPVMAALFHIVFIYGYRQHRCTDLFIEVNPRHCRYYETMLGFTRMGSVKHNYTVEAPAQLMWLKVDEIRKRIDLGKAGPEQMPTRSLYPHFFSPREEDGVFGRLVREGEFPLSDHEART